MNLYSRKRELLEQLMDSFFILTARKQFRVICIYKNDPNNKFISHNNNNFDRYKQITEQSKHNKTMRLRSEIGIFLSVAVTLFQVINNTMTISTMSNRTQDIEDKVFPSLQQYGRCN